MGRPLNASLGPYRVVAASVQESGARDPGSGTDRRQETHVQFLASPLLPRRKVHEIKSIVICRILVIGGIPRRV
ncbi:hypothetical protein E2C01_001272 [Portunus trituberculatus]|uniref:Uncharacterized protein n=1 Tax=Portunus trituberculatus TaxID=210409 RepID=A0A5B7CHJ7_PORTR|nr:hypothetical protein [Portunus trituberculatus]